jgi:HAD superfamily hydrolase (TIGR01509 family)
MLKAILWDVDGTLAETEREGHRVAFNAAFESMGLPWRWDEAHYGELLRITGGRERLLHDMARRTDAPVLPDERIALAAELHRRKTARFAVLMQQQPIALRDGVRELIDAARSDGLRLGVATTTSRSNVVALLGHHFGPRWTQVFEAAVCGEDVQRKKPDPEVYERCLGALAVLPNEAVALEDSPGGVAAAKAAGMPVVVTRSEYFADAPIDSAVAIGPGLHTRDGWRPAPARGTGGIGVDDLRHWCMQMESVSHLP